MNVAALRSDVLAAVQGIAGLASADIVEAATVEDAWAALPRTPGVAVVYEGLEATNDPTQIGVHDRTLVTAVFAFVVTAEEWTSPAGAQDGLDALVEALRAVRTSNVGATTGRPIRLRLVSEIVAQPPERPDIAGPLGAVCRYRTTAFAI